MIVNQMRDVAQAIGIEFELASLNEANLGLDKRTQWPVIILMPPDITEDQGTSGAWTGTINPAMLYFLTRLDQATPSLPRHEVWDLANEPMRQKSLQFINRMNMSGFLDKPATQGRNTPVYSLGDATIHGNLLQIQFVFREKAAC